MGIIQELSESLQQGDAGKAAELTRRAIDGEEQQWFTPHGFPVLERLLEHVKSALFKTSSRVSMASISESSHT